MDEYVGIGPVEKRDPQAHVSDPRGIIRGHSNGLTKREYFAARAMQVIVPRWATATISPPDKELMAKEIIELADAIIKELAK